jgi:hypothetical protein
MSRDPSRDEKFESLMQSVFSAPAVSAFRRQQMMTRCRQAVAEAGTARQATVIRPEFVRWVLLGTAAAVACLMLVNRAYRLDSAETPAVKEFGPSSQVASRKTGKAEPGRETFARTEPPEESHTLSGAYEMDGFAGGRQGGSGNLELRPTQPGKTGTGVVLLPDGAPQPKSSNWSSRQRRAGRERAIGPVVVTIQHLPLFGEEDGPVIYVEAHGLEPGRLYAFVVSRRDSGERLLLANGISDELGTLTLAPTASVGREIVSTSGVLVPVAVLTPVEIATYWLEDETGRVVWQTDNE